MKTEIGCCGQLKKPISRKAKLLAVAALFPWSLALYPAYKLADMMAHFFGGCIGH